MKTVLFGLIVFLSTAVALGGKGKWFDEVYFPDGRVRPQYAEAVEALGDMSPEEIVAFVEEAKRRFSGDTPMAPMPRVLTESEYELLARGTRQRAETIRRFLKDLQGAQTFRDKVIPSRVIDEILERSGEGSFWRHAPKGFAAKARFLYGPDVIRRADGKFVVLEDNTGFVGAPGDIGPAREIYEVMMPDLVARLRLVNDPNRWFEDLYDRFRSLAHPPLGHRMTDGAFVVYSLPPYGDKEDMRMNRIIRDLGGILVTPNTRDRRIVVDENGAYVEFKGHFGRSYRKRIGFLWLNAEHAWVDWHHPALREKALLDEARSHLDEKLKKAVREEIEAALIRDPKTRALDLDKLEAAIDKSPHDFESSRRRKSRIPGLVDAILSGRVQTNYTPGLEFVGDKMLHSYLDELTRFYLGEEPVLPGASTKRFIRLDNSGNLVADRTAIDNALRNRKTSVIKIVDGRGGDGIHIGPKMTEAAWRALRERIEKEPTRYVVQEYSHPSVVDDRIVDIRMITFVDETGKPVVSDTPWTRSNVLKGGDGKVNMSQHGTLMVVLVVSDRTGKCSAKIAKPRRRF